MRSRHAAARAAALLLLAATACSPPARHATLSFFFDGVPPLAPAAAPGEPMAAHVASGPARYAGHGPYAARLCDSCHESTSADTFVAPRDKLCTTCHDMGPARQVVHDPFDDCLSCHDPHDSAYPFLLVAAPNAVCADCHEQGTLPEDPAHTDPARECVDCHDPHQSDKESLQR